MTGTVAEVVLLRSHLQQLHEAVGLIYHAKVSNINAPPVHL